MAENPVAGVAMTVLCASCGDAVSAEARCPTCGDPDPQRHSGGAAVSEEALLNQVGAALAAQSALARRTAGQRMETAQELARQALVLQARLRAQRTLLRSRVAERDGPLSEMNAALERVERALAQGESGGDIGSDWSISARLPRDMSCSAVARRLVERVVRGVGEPGLCEDVTLIASELVTNAFVHGEGTIELSVRRLHDRLRIEVRDDGRPGRIHVTPGARGGQGGRGLSIVDELATVWGAADGIALVWAEFALR